MLMLKTEEVEFRQMLSDHLLRYHRLSSRACQWRASSEHMIAMKRSRSENNKEFSLRRELQFTLSAFNLLLRPAHGKLTNKLNRSGTILHLDGGWLHESVIVTGQGYEALQGYEGYCATS
jgi:hypothetical protein